MAMASALRRSLARGSQASSAAAVLGRRQPCAGTWLLTGRCASASTLVTEVERHLASGQRLSTGGELYEKLTEEIRRLRADNDRIMAEIDGLKKARAEHVTAEAKAVEELRADEHAHLHGPQMISTLDKIRELDSQLAGLRCQQFANAADVGSLKREKVSIEQREEVTSLVAKVKAAIESGEDIQEDGPLFTALLETVHRFQAEYDGSAHAAMNTKKDVENSLAKIKSAELTIRVRRDKVGPEVDSLRATLVSTFYEARRKMARMSALLTSEAALAKECGVLERARDKLRRHISVREVIKAGDKVKIEVAMKELWRDIDAMQKSINELEVAQERHSRDAAVATDKLRALKDVVTPETGVLREMLVAALREEEFSLARLSVLRSTQAQDVRFLQDLQAALAR